MPDRGSLGAAVLVAAMVITWGNTHARNRERRRKPVSGFER